MSRCAAISKYMVFDLPTGRELSMTIYIIFDASEGSPFLGLLVWYEDLQSFGDRCRVLIISNMLSFIYTLYLNLARRD